MKNLIFIGIFFLTIGANAQYTTPGTGVVWDFTDLVANSDGVVIADPENTRNGFIVNGTVTIAPTDELLILSNITVKIQPDVDIVFSSSKFTVDAPDQALFTALDEENVWGRIVIDDDAIVDIKKATFTYGKGVRIAIDPTGAFTADDCEFSHNYYSSSTSGAINLTRGFATIKNSKFIGNYYPAIASAANTASTFLIENNYLEGNVTSNSNRPQINIGPCAAGETSQIIGNAIIGNRAHTMVGGISTSSLMAVPCDFIIKGNHIKDNRYGITLTGSNINGKIIGNILEDNNTEVNPMVGGSGINITNSAGNVFAYISQNMISGHHWGITAVGNLPTLTLGPSLNLGNIEVEPDHPDYNIGMNFFDNNGNGGYLYDFYNNNPNDVMAQNNNWGVEVQDPEHIETVVWHKPNNPLYGTVTYMPAYIEPPTYTVTGRVVDENGPLVGATLTLEIEDNTYHTTIGTSGIFQTIPIVTGTFITLTISCEGYYDYSTSFTIEDEDVDLEDILMIPIIFPAPHSFDMTYVYFGNIPGWCDGQPATLSSYCTTLEWEEPDLSETEAQLIGYNLYFFYTWTYYEGMEIPFSEVEQIAFTTSNYLILNQGFIGVLWVTALYSEPEGESEPSNYHFNEDLPISIDKDEISSYSIIYNKQQNVVKISGIENINSVTIFSLDGSQINFVTDNDFNRISLKNISKGVYIVKITTALGNIISDRIIID